MTERRDPLDAAFAALPKSVQPTRDLWPEVRAAIIADERAAGRTPSGAYFTHWRQLAAAVVLAVAASATTYVVTRETMTNDAQLAQDLAPAPLIAAMPASFSGENLGEDYFKARAVLDAEFEKRLAALPPATRAKLENDLADLRRAANEIAVTLAQHPSDPLLQDLLMSTYQSELKLFANVNELTTRTLRTNL